MDLGLALAVRRDDAADLLALVSAAVRDKHLGIIRGGSGTDGGVQLSARLTGRCVVPSEHLGGGLNGVERPRHGSDYAPQHQASARCILKMPPYVAYLILYARSIHPAVSATSPCPERGPLVSRKYAHILTAIWRNEDFRDLTRDAQHGYLQLATQADISAAGVLALSLTRWAAQSRGTTPAMVAAVLTELQTKRFIVFDPATEELLVRSFVRWDGGYTNSKRLPVIERAAKDVLSPTIQRALAAEFARLGLDSLSDSLSAAATPSSDRQTGFPQVDTVSDTVSPSDGVVVTKKTTEMPQPPVPKPPAPSALPAPPTVQQRSKTITDAYYVVEPMCNWPAVNGIVAKAIRTGRWADDAIREAMIRLAKDGRSVTVDSLRVELDGLPADRQRPRQSTSDAAFNAALAAGQAVEAKLNGRTPPKEITS